MITRRALVPVILLLLVVCASVGYFGLDSCENQDDPYHLSAYCQQKHTKAATRGDYRAMDVLAEYYDGHDKEKALNWRFKAAGSGSPTALHILQRECSVADSVFRQRFQDTVAKEFRPDNSALSLELMRVFLGSRCVDLNLEKVRNYFVRDLDRPYVASCDIAVRYGEVVLSGQGNQVDRDNVQRLLMDCVDGTSPGGERQSAEKLLRALSNHGNQTGQSDFGNTTSPIAGHQTSTTGSISSAP